MSCEECFGLRLLLLLPPSSAPTLREQQHRSARDVSSDPHHPGPTQRPG